LFFLSTPYQKQNSQRDNVLFIPNTYNLCNSATFIVVAEKNLKLTGYCRWHWLKTKCCWFF